MVSLISAYLLIIPSTYIARSKTRLQNHGRTRRFLATNSPNKPVYLLTSSRTISAAEQFTYNLKMLKRATLVGETTAGGAHAGSLHSIGDNFYIATVEVRAINPYSKYNWNATGIEPDVKASAPDALQVALRLAGEKLSVK
jgi:C-terminal processing protease CtpA/Prc